MPYAVQLADPEVDRAGILDVWKGSLRSGDAEHFRWIYQENPFGPVSCWVVRDGSQAVVGTAAVLPRILADRGRRWRAGITIDFAVSRAHRALGAALLLQNVAIRACREQYDLLYGFPNDASKRVQLRAGFASLGPASDARKTLRTASTLSRRYGAAARLAAPALDITLRALDAIVRPRAGGTCLFREAPAFDRRFDFFWSRVQHTLPLTGERTSTYLDWRFGRCPHTRYRTLVMEDSAGAMTGYAIWSIREGEVAIADLIAENGCDGVLALVAELLRRARELGAHSVRARHFGSPVLADVLRRLGFRISPSSREMVICTFPSTPLADAVAHADHWYLLDGDTDV